MVGAALNERRATFRPRATKPCSESPACLSLGFLSAIYPLLAPLFGRPWRQAEVFGITPDPTALATLGVALLAPARTMWLLLPLPLLWCLVSGATLWTMKASDAALLPAIGVLALGLGIATSRARGRVCARGHESAGPPSHLKYHRGRTSTIRPRLC